MTSGMNALRVTTIIALCAMAALQLMQVADFFGYSVQVLRWPYELDYGEGIVWQQANLMFTDRAYGAIDGVPGIVFHYTPLYHVVTRGVAALTGMDMLYAGRLVSIISTLLTVIVVGALVVRAAPSDTPGVARWLAGIAAALTIFCMWPITYWAQLMRVDMIAFLLSMLGFWLGLKALDRPRLIYAAAVAFVAAIYAKQTSIAAPAALFLVFLWLRRDLAVRGIAACLVIGTVALVGLTWVTDGGFIRHIFLYNLNEFALESFAIVTNTFRAHTMLLIVALIMMGVRLAAIYQRRGTALGASILQNREDVAFIAVIAYLMLTTLMLGLVLKLGSAVNYTIEFLFVIAVLVGLALIDAARMATNALSDEQKTLGVRVAAIAVPLAVAVHGTKVVELPFDEVWAPQRTARIHALEDIVRAADKPVISDEMVLVIRAGKEVVWESAIFGQLYSKGVWDDADFIRRMRAQEFSMFVTMGGRGEPLFDFRYPPRIRDAMAKYYPEQRTYAEYVVHLPASSQATAPSKPAAPPKQP